MYLLLSVIRQSPLALSITTIEIIVLQNTQVLRQYYVLQIAYIIGGRELVKLIRNKCQRCRCIAKRTIEVEMGPISNHDLNIAPPFYSTQVDLCGPFNAFSNFNKRTTVKIWFTVFCCTTTSATKIKILDDYSTTTYHPSS